MTSPGPWGGRGPTTPSPKRGWLWLILALVVAGIMALLAGPDWAPDASTAFRVVVAVVIGGSLVVMLARRLRGQLSQGLAFTAIWLGLVLVIALGYTYRGGLRDARDRVILEFMPGGADWSPGVVKVAADRSGHYVVDAKVNGVPVRFLVDTGATSVVLTGRDAERIGMAPATLNFSRTAETAGGLVKVAPVRLERVAIGQIELADVAAAVNPTGLNTSLLGMSFLGRLTGFSIEDGYLVLRR